MNRIMIVGWILFALSFVLTAADGGDSLSGFGAMKAAMSRAGEYGVGTYGPLSALTNIVMVLAILCASPLQVVRMSEQHLTILCVVAGLVNLYWIIWAKEIGVDLTWGYWLWILSFFLVAIGFRTNFHMKAKEPPAVNSGA